MPDKLVEFLKTSSVEELQKRYAIVVSEIQMTNFEIVSLVFLGIGLIVNAAMAYYMYRNVVILSDNLKPKIVSLSLFSFQRDGRTIIYSTNVIPNSDAKHAKSISFLKDLRMVEIISLDDKVEWFDLRSVRQMKF